VLFVSDTISASRDAPFLQLPGMPLYRHLAAHLAHAGFASLRYDPRGKGSSKGDATQATQALLVKDAEAALAALSAASDVDKTRIYYLSLGPSSATALTLLASKPPRGYIALAPLVKDLPAAILYTDTATFKAAGFSQKFLDAEAADTQQKVSQIQAGTFADAEWRGLPTPLWKEWLAFDGSTALGAFAGPVLALRGDQDLVMPPEQLQAATDAATKAGKANLTAQTLTGLAFTLTAGTIADLWESALLPLEVPATTIDTLTAWLKSN
jgi:pimeloyl-ACP methyl ester carboxylesterase